MLIIVFLLLMALYLLLKIYRACSEISKLVANKAGDSCKHLETVNNDLSALLAGTIKYE